MWNSKTEDRSREAGEKWGRQGVGERWVSTVTAQLCEIALRTGLFVLHSDQLNQELTDFFHDNSNSKYCMDQTASANCSALLLSIKVTLGNKLQVKKAVLWSNFVL